jgi:hypothetical protein
MRHSRTVYSVLALASTFAALSHGIALGQDAARSGSTEAVSRGAANELSDDFYTIRGKLAQRVPLVFEETPLDEALASTGEALGVEIMIHRRSLEEGLALQASVPISFELRQARAAVALREMLNSIAPELDYAIRDGYLLVSTKEHLLSLQETRVYRHGQLPRTGSAGTPIQNPYAAGVAESSPSERYRQIVTSVEPLSWQENGGTGRVAYINGNLVIWQSPRIHEMIADLLDDLRAADAEDTRQWEGERRKLMPAADPAAPPVRQGLPVPVGPASLPE